jgi:hypothetical protein
MRSALVLGCVILLAAVDAPAAPEAPRPTPLASSDIRYIIRDVEVRSGPSDQFYATNLLRRGDKVEVLHESEGWLVIRPPEGSFSWIDTRYLQNVVPRQPNFVVTPTGAAVPVFIGSSIYRGNPTKEGARLQRGTQVRSIGAPQRAPDGRSDWMPIEAPAAENRYLPAAAVIKEPPAQTIATVRTSALAPVVSLPAPPLNPDLLWRQALQAESERRIPDAIRLYEAAGEANRTVNPDRSIAAYERARLLQTGRTSAGATSAFVPARTDLDSGGLRIPATPVVTAPTGWNSGQPAAPAVPAGAPAVPGRLDPHSLPASAWQSGVHGPGWTPTGWLRRGYRVVERERTYVLEDSQGRPLYYILPQAGLDLEPHVGHNVELYGSLVYHGELRTWLMTATGAQAAP